MTEETVGENAPDEEIGSSKSIGDEPPADISELADNSETNDDAMDSDLLETVNEANATTPSTPGPRTMTTREGEEYFKQDEETPLKSNLTSVGSQQNAENFKDSRIHTFAPDITESSKNVVFEPLSEEFEEEIVFSPAASSVGDNSSVTSSVASEYVESLTKELKRQPSKTVMTPDRRLSLTVDMETGMRGSSRAPTRGHRAHVRGHDVFLERLVLICFLTCLMAFPTIIRFENLKHALRNHL